jgi:hypothetical protein
MGRIIAVLLIFVTVSAQAVILVPGKIENPLRADKILTEKFKAKKMSIARYRKVLKEKYAAKKKAQARKVASLAAPSNDDQQLQSKGIPSDGSQIREPLKPLQEVKETNR